MTLIYVIGARPNMVKLAPVIARLRERLPDDRHVVAHTGQHYDYAMSEIFFDELRLPPPDHFLGVGPGSHGAQTARALEGLEKVFTDEKPHLVVVAGDVNSTLAGALAAVKLRIPIAHVESGLRSFDRTMPEEINRIVADEFADLLFAHSDEALTNLQNEGIAADRIHLVGNTMIDTLVALEPQWRERDAATQFGRSERDYVLVTLHRPALVDGPLLPDVMAQLRGLGETLPVLFPVHPRTRARLGDAPLEGNVQLIDPLGYLDFLSLEADAAAVLTDSGGVQEETTYLGVACFTLRDTTERPVTVRIGTNTILGLEPERIATIPALLDGDAKRRDPPPLWDGHAAERLADVTVEFLAARR